MRADLEIIQEWIPAGSRVLDLGCGDGELLSWLRDNKQVTGYGLENDPDNIAQCVAKGINVIEQDLDKGLGNFASNSFDIVVMTQALQAHVTRRALGMPSTDVVTPHPDDARFADAAWTDSATWDIVKEWYLAFTHRLQDMAFETPGLSEKEQRRAAFWLRKWLNLAVAPSKVFARSSSKFAAGSK